MDEAQATVTYITAETLGKLLPDGWAIEVSAGWYTAFLGEQVALQPYRKLVDALSSIQLYRRSPIYKALTNAVAQAFEQRDFFGDEGKGANDK